MTDRVLYLLIYFVLHSIIYDMVIMRWFIIYERMFIYLYVVKENIIVMMFVLC